jgi:hypothetical protein
LPMRSGVPAIGWIEWRRSIDLAANALDNAWTVSFEGVEVKVVVAASIESARLVCLGGRGGPLSCNTRNS